MTIWELTDFILYLQPDAKFACWDTTDLNEYQGDQIPIVLDNKFIDWSPLNSQPCPTIEEINACGVNEVKQAAEFRRKNARNEAMKHNMSVVASYKVAKISNQNLTWEEFLDSLEEEVE